MAGKQMIIVDEMRDSFPLNPVIDDVLKSFPGVIWGGCKLDFSRYQENYRYGCVLIVPLQSDISSDNYSEIKISEAQALTRQYSDQLCESLKKVFDSYNIEYEFPIMNPAEVNQGFSPISGKYIAVRSGLGWIGKNDLLITKKYGPRIHIIPFVMNHWIEVGASVSESLCGTCRICVERCPFQAIQGVLWKDQDSITRDRMIDFSRCRDGRDKAGMKQGKRIACGRCMIYCPIGKKE